MGNSYASKVDYWLSENGLLLLQCWSRDGITQKDIAERIGIKPQNLSKWKEQYPEIEEALSTGKEIVDYKVENALLKSALGFTTKEITVTIGQRQVNGEWVSLTKETKTKEIAPNVTAALAWLNNRKPDVWKRNRDKIVEIDDEETDVKITIERGEKNDLDESVNKGTTINEKDIKKAQKQIEEDNKKLNDEWDGWEDW